MAQASRPEFGDYQSNGALPAAKSLNLNPRLLAQKLVDSKTLEDLAQEVSIAGPGFINITLCNDYLAHCLADEPICALTQEPQRVVVDYSSPNVAKEMHVGHLRSTVIGDSVVRMLSLAGHHVIRQNHVGDWGTTFGKLIAYIDEIGSEEQLESSLSDIEQLYVAASQRFDQDPDFAARSREAALRLQNRDPQVRATWQKFMQVSLDHMHDIYRKLDVLLTADDVRGESAYSEELPRVVEELHRSGILVESKGAQCVFVDGFHRKDGSPLPMIVQKSDGGYLYHTTDLATLLYRARVLRADQVLYFTDSRQIHHFQLLFAVARKAEFVKSNVKLEHHVFGSILNADGEPFKTRSGENILLADLIEEGIARAKEVVAQKSNHLNHEAREEIANQIAIGAIKYADLSKNRTHDYRFDWDTMLALDGNTAPYLQYAYARINAIFAKANLTVNEVNPQSIAIAHRAEHNLAVRLMRFQEILDQSVEERKAHHMCNYLYDLTVHFTRFYENCNVLNAESTTRDSRLAICARVAQTLRTGLGCLGISAPMRM